MKRIDEVLDRFDPFNISHNDFLRLKPQAVQDLKRIIEEMLPEERDSHGGDNAQEVGESIGYNHALDDVRQQLEEKL